MFRLLAIRSIVFPFLNLVWRLLLDKRVPLFTKIIPFLAIIYIVSPFDFIADRIPVLGQFDDLIVTGILLLVFIAASPKEVVADQTIGRSPDCRRNWIAVARIRRTAFGGLEKGEEITRTAAASVGEGGMASLWLRALGGNLA